MGNEVKITLVTDASGAVTGIKTVSGEFVNLQQSADKSNKEIEKTTKASLEKNLSAYKEFTGKVKDCWLEILGAYALVTQAIDYAKLGAQALQTEESFHNVTAAYGESAEHLLKKMKQVSAGIIDDSDLMQRAVKGLQQGLSSDQIVSLLEVARSSARVAGIDIASAFDRITEASANQQTRGLKALGIVIDQERAFEKYARVLGVGKDALTEMQQSQAIANAAIEEGQRQMKAMGNITENATEKIQKAEAQLHELKETIGKGLVAAVQAAGGLMYWLAAGALSAAGYVMKLGSTIMNLSPFENVKQQGAAMANDSKAALDAAGELADKGMKLWEGITLNAHGASAAIKGTAKAHQELANQRENAKIMAENFKEWNNKIEALNPNLDAAVKEIMELQKAADELRKKTGGDQKWITEGLEKGIQYIKEKYAKEQKKAFEDLMTEMYQARLTGINKDLAAIDEWLYNAAMKVKGNAEMVSRLMSGWDFRRYEKLAEYSKKAMETDIENLKKLREAHVKLYDDAIAKAQQYYDIARQAGDIGKSIRDYLAGYNAPQMSLAEQADKERKQVLEGIGKATGSYDLKQAESAAKAGMDFLTKYKGFSDALGFTQDWGDVRRSLEELASHTDRIKYDAELSGNAWEKFADRQAAAIKFVDDWIKSLEGHIKDIDTTLTQVRELKIDTSKAMAQLEAIGLQVASVNNLIAGASPTPKKTGGGKIEVSYDDSYSKMSNEQFYDVLKANPTSQALADIASKRDWTLGSYAAGTDYVPRTGPYILHQGESVNPANQNDNRKYSQVSVGNIVINMPNVRGATEQDADALAREIYKKLKVLQGRNM